MDEARDWQEFAQRMAAMARDLLAQDSVGATLDRITASAVALVDGCEAAGILILTGDGVRSLAATDPLVADSDRLQESLGEGPCYDAARPHVAERVFRIEDFTEHAERWPKYVPEARALGLGSMMGFLLFTRDEEFGALNLYSRRPGAFDGDAETGGWLLAAIAAVALSSARNDAQLHEALSTRHTIGQAMGIIMGRHHLGEEQAFDVLRRYSQENNIKLREVARRVVETGDVSVW